MSVTNFLANNVGWTFNFITAHILWWAVGFPTVLEYGYSDSNFNSKGGIPSGGSGSGVFIITLVVVLLTTIIFLKQIRDYCCGCEVKEE